MDQDVKLTKNQTTKVTLAKTKARRKTQACLVREIKLAAPKDVMQTTHDLFKQSKWLGTLKAKLKSKGAVVVGRFEPTTKQCYVCGTSNAIGLDDRVYECSTCGHTEHRDVKAAKTIMQKANMRVPDGIIMETKPFNYNVKVYSNIKQERNDSCDEVIPAAINHCKVVDSKVLLMTQNKKEEASLFRAR